MTHTKSRSLFVRLLSAASALAAAALAVPAVSVSADNGYGIYVCGVEVTDDNCGDILGDGVFYYNTWWNQLEVNGVVSASATDYYPIIKSSCENLTICFSDSTLTHSAANYPVLDLRADTVINGNKATLTHTGASPILVQNAELTISDIELSLTGADCGIAAIGSADDMLILSRADLDITAGSTAFTGFSGGIELRNTAVLEPVSYTFMNGTVIGGNNAASAFRTTGSYQLKVGDVTVTNKNRADILGNGVFQYDPKKNMLTVSGSYTANKLVIENWIEGLTVNIAADSVLTSESDTALWFGVSTLVTGKGHLTVNADFSGMYIFEGELELRYLDAEINGYYGISGANHDESLRINCCSLDINTEVAAILGIRYGIELRNCHISDPYDAVIWSFNDETSVCDAGGTLLAEVTITESLTEFPLTINGTTVSNENAGDILGDGTASFIPAENTLTLNGLSIESTAAGSTAPAIWSEIDGLIINIAGDCTIKATNAMEFADSNATITGSGKLTISDAEDSAVYVRGGTLTLDHANIDITSSRFGFIGQPYEEELVIDCSTVHVNSTVGAIMNFASGIVLENCEITSPAGAGVFYVSRYGDEGGDGEGEGGGDGFADGWESVLVSEGGAHAQEVRIEPEKPKITAQPHSATLPIGSTAKFSLSAEGTGLTYQWQYNSGNGWKESNGTGAKTNELSIAVTAGRHGWKYRCLVTNAAGAKTYSSAVTLKAKTVISQQPANASRSIGEKAEFTVKATGAALTYQWQFNKGDGWKNSNGTGAKTNTLSINVSAGYNGYQYRCILTNASGNTATSSAAALTVKTVITKQPANADLPLGETAVFTVAASGAGLSYQWQYNSGSGWKSSGGTGASTAALSIPVTTGRNGWQYRCVITDANGKKTYSSVAKLTAKTVITAQPNGIRAAIGDTAKFTVTASGAGLSYQWQYNSGDGWKNSNSTGATTAALSINAKNTYNGWKYRCVITDANGVKTISSVATLKIKTSITAQPANISAAAGTTASFTVKATGYQLTYQWQYNSGSGWKNSNGTGAATATLSINAKQAYNGWQYRCVITDGNGSNTISAAAKLTVK